MRTTRQMSITLPVEMARLVSEKVSTGAYASESEVIREGLRALQERDNAVERWLQTEVVPAYDAWKSDPAKTSSLDEVMARLDGRAAAAGRTGEKP